MAPMIFGQAADPIYVYSYARVDHDLLCDDRDSVLDVVPYRAWTTAEAAMAAAEADHREWFHGETNDGGGDVAADYRPLEWAPLRDDERGDTCEWRAAPDGCADAITFQVFRMELGS
jgi:hypothetical protein